MKQFAPLLLLGVLTCSSSEASDLPVGTRHEVKMRSVSYSPRELTLTLGDTVMWRNVDIVRHDVAGGKAFESEELQPGETYSWVPADTGRYRYHCTIHQRMRGQIVVTRAP